MFRLVAVAYRPAVRNLGTDSHDTSHVSDVPRPVILPLRLAEKLLQFAQRELQFELLSHLLLNRTRRKKPLHELGAYMPICIYTVFANALNLIKALRLTARTHPAPRHCHCGKRRKCCNPHNATRNPSHRPTHRRTEPDAKSHRTSHKTYRQ